MQGHPRFPLSQAQLGIWLGHQRAEDRSIYNAAEVLLFDGSIDVARFTSALDATLREATALHLAFAESNGTPHSRPIPFEGSGLCVRQGPEPLVGETALLQYASRQVRNVLHIDRGELFRHELLELTDGRHAWLHIAHHVALDGYGFNLIARRVAERYAAAAHGSLPAAAPFSPLQPVLAEDAAYQASPDRESDRRFWLEAFGRNTASSCAGAAALPPLHPHRTRRSLTPEIWQKLKATARSGDVSWADLVLAAVATRLGDVLGSRAFVLGLPVMLRLGSAALKTPCMAMNICPLPVDLSEVPTLLALAQRLRANLARQRPHQRYRYEHLRVDRAHLGARLFGPVVNLMPFDFPLRFGECSARILGVSAGPVEDLAVSLVPRGSALELLLDGHPRLFGPGDLLEIAEQTELDVARCANAPESPLPSAYPRPASPPRAPSALEPLWPIDSIRRHARACPGAVALDAPPHRYSYADLERAVGSGATQLRALGCGPGDVVALDVPRGALAVTLILAILEVGAAYVALDPSEPRARRRSILDRVRPRVLVQLEAADLDASIETNATRLRVSSKTLQAWVDARGDAARADTPLGPQPGQTLGASHEGTAYVAFTSGTTGDPKGVVVSRSALAHFVAAARTAYGIAAGDRVLQFAALSFDASVEEIFVTLASGATLTFRDDAMLEAPEAFVAACQARQLTVLDLPTAFWHELTFAMIRRDVRLPQSVRLVIIGGEAALPERVAGFLERAPAVRLLNTYGPSEATVVATFADLSQRSIASGDVPIGAPLACVQAVLCDASRAIIDTPDCVGELYVLGPTLASGYLRQPALTEERFVTLPELGRAYRTGDLARRRADGQLVYVGRADDEFKLSGYRVVPSEIESVLCRHPEIRAAVVWGETARDGSRSVVAHVEASPVKIDMDALRHFLGGRLPAAVIPSLIRAHAALPRTAHGKLDRVALRASSRSPERASVPQALSPEEREVLQVWRGLLNLDAIHLDADFFAIGGNSLGVIQLANRLSQRGREVRVAEIFQHPTPRQQARLLAEHTQEIRAAAPFVPWSVALPDAWSSFGQSAPDGGVLLTGATGFVGIHLLESLLAHTRSPITCPVRASSPDEGVQRLLARAKEHGIALEQHAKRLHVEALDLTSPEAEVTALSSRVAPCGVVFHCAAEVSLVRGYESLVPVNVLATRELLGLAARWGSSFHFVSSIATLPQSAFSDPDAERFYACHADLVDGYQRSKWHAETLCAEAGARGLNVAVYRLGRVTGSRRRPSVNHRDLFWRMAQASVRLGVWPALGFEEHWMPADVASDTMIRLALTGSAASPGRVYHVVQTGVMSPLRVCDTLRRLGIELTLVPVADWLERLRETRDPELTATLAVFEQHASAPDRAPAMRQLSWSKLAERLPDLDCRAIGADLLAAYCRHALQSGFIAPPGQRLSAPST